MNKADTKQAIVASMRPPPESGGYLRKPGTEPGPRCRFNEAAARKRRIPTIGDTWMPPGPRRFNEAAARKRRILNVKDSVLNYADQLQ